MKSQITTKKVFVAMSGGVDSSVAAALLKERGFDVRGVHMKMWSDPSLPCTAKEDRVDAIRAAAHIGIPFETWNFTDEYRKAVVEYMVREYADGRTPNPDVMCNREIKFGIFLKEALRRGADWVATGHYVRVVPLEDMGTPRCFVSATRLARSSGALAKGRRDFRASREPSKSRPPLSQETKHLDPRETICSQEFKLLNGVDEMKDQSYFLWTLTQEQLKYCFFPIGEYTKAEVRAMARKFGLPNAEKPDSQGVCFIGEFDMREFLQRYILTTRGVVRTTAGKIVGDHEGVQFYTIGQRHGLGVVGGRPPGVGESRPKGAGGIPYYVAQKDFKTNTLVVAEGPYDECLFEKELTVEHASWVSGSAPKLPLRCEARIRYRQPLQKAKLFEIQNSKFPPRRGEARPMKLGGKIQNLRVVFNNPQRAITPGQSAVFYKGSEVLGGGVIGY